MSQRIAHLADLVAIALGPLLWVAIRFIAAGPFEAQIVSTGAHVALSLGCAGGVALALRFAIALERPRWVWPAVILSSSLAFSELIRVVNALDGSEPRAQRTHVALWRTAFVTVRGGSGHWVRHVVLASWRLPGEQLEFLVPEGVVTRESGFAQAGRDRFPGRTMDQQMWPDGVACEVLTRPGTLGLEHVVGLRLLIDPPRESP